MVVRKYADGAVEVIDLDTLAGELSFTRFAGARSGLLGPDDIAQAVAMLVASDYLTGEVLLLDGGLHLT